MPQKGLISSHFTFDFLQSMQPFLDRRFMVKEAGQGNVRIVGRLQCYQTMYAQ